jgi:hypothetical protein
MSMNEMTDFAARGLQEAVRRSTVGIVSGSGDHKWKGIGAGALVHWKGHHLVLTAEHVIGATLREDLRFFFPFGIPPKTVERETLQTLRGAPTSELQTFKQIELGRLAVDPELDLATMEVDSRLDSAYAVRFIDLVPGKQTPPEGTDILATGFPRDIARQTIPGDVVVFPHTEWTEVGPIREGLPGFDSSRHFLADYHTAEDYPGANPTGLSGSSFWFHRPTPDVWHPNIDVAGVTSSWYSKHRMLKIIRREVVEGFLTAIWS